MLKITPEQLAAIHAIEDKAGKALHKRLSKVPFGTPGDTVLTRPIDKKTMDAVIKAVRDAGAIDAAALITVLGSLAGAGASAFFTGRIPVLTPSD